MIKYLNPETTKNLRSPVPALNDNLTPGCLIKVWWSSHYTSPRQDDYPGPVDRIDRIYDDVDDMVLGRIRILEFQSGMTMSAPYGGYTMEYR